MLDFAHGFLMRSAVMVPALMIVSIGAWSALRKLQMMRLDEPFDAADMRTWPLAYAMADAAIFGLVFSAIVSALGDGQLTAAVGGGGAALVAIGAVPLLIAKWRR
ncbi:hypothetical protein [Hyphomicrobium denitrificans]|nr:hypothetical protein [Hyphomicrobium denitrificans]